MEVGSGYKPGKYETVGLIVVIINIISTVITFLILFNDLFKAILVLLIQVTVTIITSLPFFYLEEAFERIKSLEMATYNNFYNASELAKAKSSYSDVKDEEVFKGLCFDDYTQEPVVEDEKPEPQCRKKVINDKKWQCSCGRINLTHTGTCACGEKKPLNCKSNDGIRRDIIRKLVDNSWLCSCGRKNAEYVGTCACGERKPK